MREFGERSSEFGAVFFDATRTLIHPYPSSAENYVRVASAHGISLNVEEMKVVVKDLWTTFFPTRRRHTAFRGTNEEYEKNWWREFISKAFERLGATCSPECFEDIFYFFSKGEAWAIYPDAVPVVTGIRDRGYQTGIISNFDTRLVGVLNDTRLVALFDHILISSLFGWEKPDPPIFAEASRLAGVPPSGCLHIGDSFDADFLGAKQAGFVPILLVRDEKEFSKVQPLDSNHSGVPTTIHDLTELLRFL